MKKIHRVVRESENKSNKSCQIEDTKKLKTTTSEDKRGSKSTPAKKNNESR